VQDKAPDSHYVGTMEIYMQVRQKCPCVICASGRFGCRGEEKYFGLDKRSNFLGGGISLEDVRVQIGIGR
jgi:hypothetical protein